MRSLNVFVFSLVSEDNDCIENNVSIDSDVGVASKYYRCGLSQDET